ncbi:MAG TPA: disulfide bond formation protein B [Rhizobiaceae bacterium]|nr:disulfide bond formation protein B [Rhizobiaceae bacterium]
MSLLSVSASPRSLALLLFAGMGATVGAALLFEHVGGFIPCALCLKQRTPYYLGLPVAAIAFASAMFGGPRWLTRAAFTIAAGLMLWGGGLGVYHSGVEWGWWQGPADCAATAGGVTRNAGDLLADLNAKRPPSCTDAAGRFLGLSFAGWNVIASALWLAVAVRGARG